MSTMTSRRMLASALAAVCIGVCAEPASAQPASKPGASSQAAAAPAAAPKTLAEELTGPARAEYEAGKLLYVDGDYRGALMKFQRAHDLSSDARLLWNMAACEKNLRHYARALELAERYVRDRGPLLTEQNKTDAAEFIRALRAFVGTLEITANETGAAVFIDDLEVDSTPLAQPLVVDMGTRKIRVAKRGFVEFKQTLVMAGADHVKLAVTLEREVHEGRLVVTARESEIISVDGKVVGKGHWEGKLPSGTHTLRVTAPGMKPYETEIALQDNELRRVQVGLEAEAKPGRSYLWAWIAGGALVAAGAAVGGYFLFRPKDEGPPPPVEGSIPPGTIQLPYHRGAW